MHKFVLIREIFRSFRTLPIKKYNSIYINNFSLSAYSPSNLRNGYGTPTATESTTGTEFVKWRVAQSAIFLYFKKIPETASS
jgi:hypothetical protein